MAYIQADVDLMNKALRRIGSESITISEANNPASKNSKVVVSYYDDTVKEVLRILPWNAAIARAQVTGVADATTNFTNKYALTGITDLVRTLEINGNQAIPYRLEGSDLFCSETTPIRLRYIKKLTPPFTDPILTEAVVSRLASKICYAITGLADLAQVLYQEFAMDLAQAKMMIAVEDRADLVDLLGIYQNAQIAIMKNKTQG